MYLGRPIKDLGIDSILVTPAQDQTTGYGGPSTCLISNYELGAAANQLGITSSRTITEVKQR